MSRYSLWLDKYQEKKESIIDDLRRYKKEIDLIKGDLSQKNIILPVSESDKNLKDFTLSFVDGGEGLDELLGCAIYYIRASGLNLNREGDSFVRDLDIGILKHNDNTKERVELLRAIMELDIAERCVKEKSSNYLFLDGSLYVNATKKEIESPEYLIFKKKFSRLLKLCKEEKVHICGVSEDSKSRLLINSIYSRYNIKIPNFMTDSSLLKFLTKKDTPKFVTEVFTPESKFSFLSNARPVSFPTVYLQPTVLSNPLRIDVPNWEEENLKEIVEILVKLSKGSKWYGYPCPLYLVHLDAKIEKKQTEWNTRQIVHHITREEKILYDTILKRKRRDERPGE